MAREHSSDSPVFLVMLRFFAILLTGLALIAPAAHLYETAKKMVLSKSEYFVVQKIYIGRWIAGLLLPLALVANLAFAYLGRNLFALGAAALILVNLVIFYFYTYPVKCHHPELECNAG